VAAAINVANFVSNIDRSGPCARFAVYIEPIWHRCSVEQKVATGEFPHPLLYLLYSKYGAEVKGLSTYNF
jgi:hypothetical protein